MRGKFITFEGIDGSGKSTQLRMLSGALRQRKFDVLSTCEPGGTPLGRRLREAFLETEETVSPLAELLLFAADRAQHVDFLVRPALKQEKIVISDRYADATIAYQGAGRGFEKEIVEQIINLATGGLKPDVTLFFDLPVEKALSRTNSRKEQPDERKNRMDSETSDFYILVRQAYLTIAENEPQRFRVIDANRSVEEVHTKVLQTVLEFLDQK